MEIEQTESAASTGEAVVYIDGVAVEPPRPVGRPRNPEPESFHDKMRKFVGDLLSDELFEVLFAKWRRDYSIYPPGQVLKQQSDFFVFRCSGKHSPENTYHDACGFGVYSEKIKACEGVSTLAQVAWPLECQKYARAQLHLDTK